MSMKFTPAAATSTTTSPGPGRGASRSATASTSGPPIRSPTTTRMIAPSFASASGSAFHRPGQARTMRVGFERVQIPAERPAAPLPPADTHSHRRVAAMPSDVNAVDELDLAVLDGDRALLGARRLARVREDLPAH